MPPGRANVSASFDLDQWMYPNYLPESEALPLAARRPNLDSPRNLATKAIMAYQNGLRGSFDEYAFLGSIRPWDPTELKDYLEVLCRQIDRIRECDRYIVRTRRQNMTIVFDLLRIGFMAKSIDPHVGFQDAASDGLAAHCTNISAYGSAIHDGNELWWDDLRSKKPLTQGNLDETLQGLIDSAYQLDNRAKVCIQYLDSLPPPETKESYETQN